MPVMTRLQSANLAHHSELLFQAALNAVSGPLPIVDPTPDSSSVSGYSHPPAPTGPSSAQGQEMRRTLRGLSREYSTHIVEEVFKPQIFNLLSMYGDTLDYRSEPCFVIGALNYVRSMWPSDSTQVLMLGAAVLCVRRFLQSWWAKEITVRCVECPEREPEAIENVLKHIGRDHAKDGQESWEWYMQKWPLRLPIEGAAESLWMERR
ncbi:uncharacterized protein H6S33_000925 [Morchella sextelata]|uniref:uncharacterized protein n=1 Tax=Morchella sextelata TaxID=1174677 RepID=UPI001D057060|nr:uncharacterized protein H6S33_000925 [Morchella sextelata]KAH0615289.1 hypothetical protein H6S33_000925 [Morchella sextelata]